MTHIVINRDKESADFQQRLQNARHELHNAKVEDGNLHKTTWQDTEPHRELVKVLREHTQEFMQQNPDAMPQLTHTPYHVFRFINRILQEECKYVPGVNVSYDEYNDMVTGITLMFFSDFIVNEKAVKKIHIPDSIKNTFEKAL